MQDWLVGLSLLAAAAFVGWALDKAMSKQWEPLKSVGTVVLVIVCGIGGLFVFPYFWAFVEGLLYAGMLLWFVVGLICLPFLVMYGLWLDCKKRQAGR
jgi:drug/metabolite transporter (DMT)-like permease